MTISTNVHLLWPVFTKQGYKPVPAIWISHFQDGGDVTNPAGLSPCILPWKCKSGPMPPSPAKTWRQKSANPELSLCPWDQPPGMATDKFIKQWKIKDKRTRNELKTIGLCYCVMSSTPRIEGTPLSFQLELRIWSWFLSLSAQHITCRATCT